MDYRTASKMLRREIAGLSKPLVLRCEVKLIEVQSKKTGKVEKTC